MKMEAKVRTSLEMKRWRSECGEVEQLQKGRRFGGMEWSGAVLKDWQWLFFELHRTLADGVRVLQAMET